MKKIKYTLSEIDVLNVLWNSEKALTVGDIIETNPKLAKDTVHLAITKLLNKKAIKVSEVVMRKKSLVRCFVPKIDREAFVLNQFPDIDFINLLDKYMNLVSDPMELEQLQKFIKKELES